MANLFEQDYVRRLEVLRRRIERSLKNLEVHRVSPDGATIIPEPESHRPYSPGDNPGYIDWNLYARTDRYFVKSMLREKEGALQILLDVSSSMSSPYTRKAAAAREVAGAISYLSLCMGNQVQLTPWSDSIRHTGRFFTGEKSAPDLLKYLTYLPDEPSGALTDLARSLGQIMITPGIENCWVLIISDFIDSTPYQNLVKAMAAKSINFGAIQVLHPEETHPTARGNLNLADPETGLNQNRILGHRTLRRMRRLVTKFVEETKRTFTDSGGSFTGVSCQEPFEEIVMRYLASTGVMTT